MGKYFGISEDWFLVILIVVLFVGSCIKQYIKDRYL